ncbi:hypothetical protein Ahy_A07g036600 [Arachis hypogaea]|uniref:ATP-dependent DNA helicase n=1 Tax=Arachis hypogaea TaxID=3818 RepID=A0A445CGK9_ARAHY|nr:hypothetical protein Ahy_A07g036600 [Arachis hypogaea]
MVKRRDLLIRYLMLEMKILVLLLVMSQKLPNNLLIITTSRTIFTPTLESVEKVNYFILTIFPEIKNEYLSSDTTCQADENKDVQ